MQNGVPTTQPVPVNPNPLWIRLSVPPSLPPAPQIAGSQDLLHQDPLEKKVLADAIKFQTSGWSQPVLAWAVSWIAKRKMLRRNREELAP